MTDTPWRYEDEAHAEGYRVVCGVDEAGRGPLAGDVYAAAVVLPGNFPLEGLDDSKKLTERRRDALYDRITAGAVAWAVATAAPEEIDRLNILNASLCAMRRAIEKLSVQPDFVLVDGDKIRGFTLPARPIIGGDGKSASIAAASVLAKVSRDRYMKELAAEYPQYGFDKHKGYPTKAHYEAIREHGASPVHRRSFLKKLDAGPREPRAGQFGEDAAARYLAQNGYEILERNFRTRTGEIDIIAKIRDVVVFVEVKQRRDAFVHTGMDAVTQAKQRRMRSAADAWFSARHIVLPGRFDAIEVYVGEPRDSAFGPTYPMPTVRHIKCIIE